MQSVPRDAAFSCDLLGLLLVLLSAFCFKHCGGIGLVVLSFVIGDFYGGGRGNGRVPEVKREPENKKKQGNRDSSNSIVDLAGRRLST